MYHYLATGLLIGILFGMPVGAVGALTIQRTMQNGICAGLITGAASSLSDLLYACVGAFGFTFLSDALLAYQKPIHVIGAGLLAVIAVRMMRTQELQATKEMDGKGYLMMFLSSLAIAITNPAAILSFLFAFSVFGIYGSLGFLNGGLLVLGVGIGTQLWWFSIVALACVMKRRLKVEWYRRIHTIFGLILLMFSVGLIMKTIESV